MRIFLSILTVTALSSISTVASADAMEDLQGRWTTGFIIDPSGVFQYRQTWHFDADGKCRWDIDGLITHPAGNSGTRFTEACTYTLGGPSATLAGAYDLDVKFERSLVTPLHANSVKDHNEDAECGFTDWELGVPKDVTGRTCEDTDNTEPHQFYTVVEIKPDVSIQFGFAEEGSDVGTTPDNRPTSLDPEQLIERNGTGGPGVPPPPDLLPGFFNVTSYKVNPTACDDAGLGVQTSPFAAFEIYANGTVFLGMQGWTLEEGASIDACRAEPNVIRLGTQFPISEDLRDGLYKGESVSTSWFGECSVTILEAVTKRETDGKLTIKTRELRGTLTGVATADECKTRSPLIDAQRASFTCSRAVTVEGAPGT